MKKLYFIAAFLFIAATSFGQRYVNLQLKYASIPDTFIIKNPNTDAPTIISWRMINLGPDTVAVTDTFFLRLPSANLTWRLWNRSVAVGDSTTFNDTLNFNSGSANGNILWCDTLWIKSQSNQMLDTATANNKVCKTVYAKNSTLGVNDIFKAGSVSNLEVYPNPASSTISFKYDLKGNTGTVVLRDIVGRVVYQQQMEKSHGERTMEINVMNLTNGIYTVELNGADYKGLGKVVIQK